MLRKIGGCGHECFSVEDLKKLGPFLYDDRLFDQDRFPRISALCVKECKEKMKEIYRITFEGYLNAVNIYYDDSKIFKRRPDPPIMRIGCQTYKNRLEDGNLDPEYRAGILKTMKAGIINGRLVRLCDIPKGVDVEFETTGLTDSEGESEPEEEEEEYESDDE
ncbi:hypothetical protein RB653_003079 [Dictyostelium firmibasis]|uniref:Uncharacterized protein n=1 Tax=Dictyostelium firmibasis TaxID=79012 RepID=A0AAN7TYL0_9MYCE